MEPIRFFEEGKPFYQLSNYFPSPFELDEKTWPSVEVYFQAHKFLGPFTQPNATYAFFICAADTPHKAKCLGTCTIAPRGGKWLISKQYPQIGLLNEVIREYKGKVKLRSDWEEVKIEIMHRGVEAKFKSSPILGNLLKSTGMAPIEEASPYDYFWGTGRDGTGRNELGKILEAVRNKL